MTHIAVLLTVHNRREKTLACLDVIRAQQLPEGCTLDIYMTDDGCTDGTRQAVAERFPQVRIVDGDGTLFWNRGMYRAWEAAAQQSDYDFYLWLNDDTVLLPGAIAALLGEAAEKPGSVIVGPCHATADATDLTYSGHYANRHIMPNGTLQKCQTFNGNIVLIPRTIFKLIGNLDWRYEHAIGDFDYGWMVTHAGLANYVSRDFRGVCDRNPRPPKWVRPEVPFKERWANFHSPLGYGQPGPMFHFNRKHFGLLRAVAVWTSNHIRLFFPRLWSK